jgi:cell division transport system permease protein
VDYGRVQFFFREVGRNFSRNVVMQLTAIGTVAVMVLLLGAFLYTRALGATIGDDIVKKIEISVFLNRDVDAAAVQKLRTAIDDDRRVRSVAYIPKAQGLKEVSERLKGQFDTSLLTENPLPDALRVKVTKPENVHAVAASIKRMHGVATVEYAQDAVERMLKLIDVFARIGFVVVALLILTAAIIISNTIRLTVYARRREIAIMRLVGASGAYIRGPFICEGLVDGILGAAIAVGVLALARQILMPKLTAALPFIPLSTTASGLVLGGELLLVGAVVGIVASWVSVGRHLRT